ncbi:site-specific integrase [Peribacillus asahii]|uniref:site-specific integrase n=1 Tax=Peribacillus asahii TaxID=228899 RepID=UPI0037F8C59F
MKTVQPIRDEKKINAIKKILKSENLRDYAWFTLGINSGLRISDILNLTFGDVLKKEKVVNKIIIRERKTDKEKNFSLGPKTIKALEEYINSITSYELDDPLFFSKKFKDGKRKAISRQHAHYVINEAAKEVGVNESIGAHSLRKSFGYHAFKKGYDIVLIQNMLNHDSPSTTLRYIGITQDEMDEVYVSMDL